MRVGFGSVVLPRFGDSGNSGDNLNRGDGEFASKPPRQRVEIDTVSILQNNGHKAHAQLERKLKKVRKLAEKYPSLEVEVGATQKSIQRSRYGGSETENIPKAVVRVRDHEGQTQSIELVPEKKRSDGREYWESYRSFGKRVYETAKVLCESYCG